MSWESTIPYYRLINEGVKARLGGLHSASLVLHSVDFHDIEACQSAGDWDRAGAILAEAAARSEGRLVVVGVLPVPAEVPGVEPEEALDGVEACRVAAC